MTTLVERLTALDAKATPGPWFWDTYNSVFAPGETYAPGEKHICRTPDHPQDEMFGPDEITERSAWYKEADANAELIAVLRTFLPQIIAALSAKSALQARINEQDELLNAIRELFPRSSFQETLPNVVASEIAALRRQLATLTNALEDYACAGSPEKCGTTMLRDGSCVRLMAGNCGKPAYEALAATEPKE